MNNLSGSTIISKINPTKFLREKTWKKDVVEVFPERFLRLTLYTFVAHVFFFYLPIKHNTSHKTKLYNNFINFWFLTY